MSCRAEDLYSARNSILHNLQAPEPGNEDLLFPALSVRQKPKHDGWMALLRHFELPALFCTPLRQAGKESGLPQIRVSQRYTVQGKE